MYVSRVLKFFSGLKRSKRDEGDSTEDNSRLGRICTTKTNTNILTINQLIHNSQRLSIPAIFDLTRIEKENICDILYETFNMKNAMDSSCWNFHAK